MTTRKMTTADIDSVLPLYISYYNEQEDGLWTEETVKRRLHQLLSIEDSYSLIAEEDGRPLGFAIGHFRQYDEDIGYTLDDIIVTLERQSQGIGSVLMRDLEQAARARGAVRMELQATNDERHDNFYTTAGYQDSTERVSKVKWL